MNMKKIFIVLFTISVFLTGCTASAEQNDSVSISSNEKQYREFCSSDYANGNYYATSLSNEQDFKKELQQAYADNKKNSVFLKAVMEDYIFSLSYQDDESCVDITELGYVGDSTLGRKQYYYKVDIKDFELFEKYIGLNVWFNPIDTQGWSINDEIYMLCEYGYPDDEFEVWYYLKNYSVNASETSESYGEMTYADWSTLCTEKTIQTELYSVTVPDSWMSTCAYDIGGDGNTLSFKIPKEYDGVNDSGLCTITVVYGSLRDILTPYMFIETIESELYGRMHLILEYPGDKQYSDTTEEEYLMLAEDIRLLVDSITLADGVEVISTVEPIYRDFDIYDYYDVVEKQLRYIESQEQKILQPYAELKEVYERDVVSFFQGREYDEYLIGECLIENEFNNANINLECLGTYPVETGEYTAPAYYLYYKVNILDIDNVHQNYNPDWNLNDDIYVIARTRFIFNQTEGAEEECFLIAYSVKNFSESN